MPNLEFVNESESLHPEEWTSPMSPKIKSSSQFLDILCCPQLTPAEILMRVEDEEIAEDYDRQGIQKLPPQQIATLGSIARDATRNTRYVN